MLKKCHVLTSPRDSIRRSRSEEQAVCSRQMMATRQLSRRMSSLPYRIRRPARLLQERKSLSATEEVRPGALGDGEALEADAPSYVENMPDMAGQCVPSCCWATQITGRDGLRHASGAGRSQMAEG